MSNAVENRIEEIAIKSDEDVILARQRVRIQAQAMGFGVLDQTRIVTAVSELARNIVVHAKKGNVSIFKSKTEGKDGIKVVFEDMGPGMSDIERAMKEGYSTVGSLGIGLKGAKRLMDDFNISSSPYEGTKVSIIKWL